MKPSNHFFYSLIVTTIVSLAIISCNCQVPELKIDLDKYNDLNEQQLLLAARSDKFINISGTKNVKDKKGHLNRTNSDMIIDSASSAGSKEENSEKDHVNIIINDIIDMLAKLADKQDEITQRFIEELNIQLAKTKAINAGKFPFGSIEDFKNPNVGNYELHSLQHAQGLLCSAIQNAERLCFYELPSEIDIKSKVDLLSKLKKVYTAFEKLEVKG